MHMLIRHFLLFSIILAPFRFGLFAEVPLETTYKMQMEIREMRQAVDRLHYSQQNIEGLDFEELIVNYMKRLDFAYLYFLKSDETLWRARFGQTLKNTYLEKNELYPAFYIFNTYENRVADRIDWIKEYLADDVNLFVDVDFSLDDKELEWPATQADANTQWTYNINNEILNELIPEIRKKLDGESSDSEDEAVEVVDLEPVDIPDNFTPDFFKNLFEQEEWESLLQEAKDNVIRRHERRLERIREVKGVEVQEDFLTELAQLYDPHSNFMSPDTTEDFGISITNELIGIGAVLSDDNGYCKIQDLVDNGPASKSKELSAGDTILAVGQGRNEEFVDIVGKRLRDIVRLIRGEENSIVRLKIRPKTNPEQEKIVTIVRERIKLEEKLASAEIILVPSVDRTIPIGVIDLPNFYGPTQSSPFSTSASQDMEVLINKLKAQGVEGIVLDLRTNGGGLLEEAINVTGLFIENGTVVKVKYRSGDIDVNRDTNRKIAWEGPLAVLTSRYSASASEIVAGALQYYKRAIIIGDISTHGKGTVQNIFTLPISNFRYRDNFQRPSLLERIERGIPSMTRPRNPSIAKITVAKYYLPDGSSTQIRGVPSDIILPSVTDLLPINEGDLENPLPWDNLSQAQMEANFIEYSPGEFTEVETDLMEVLRTRSKYRQQSLEEFEYLKETVENFRERYNRKFVSLDLSKRLDRIYLDKRLSDKLEDTMDLLQEQAFDHIEVPLKEQPQTLEISEITENGGEAIEPEIVEEEEEEENRLDIYLRESVRVVADWVKIENHFEDSDRSNLVAEELLSQVFPNSQHLDYIKANN